MSIGNVVAAFGSLGIAIFSEDRVGWWGLSVFLVLFIALARPIQWAAECSA